MRLHLLTPKKKRRCHSFLFPLRVFKRQIRELGLDVVVFSDSAAGGLCDCDVLCVANDSFSIPELLEPVRPSDFLSSVRDRVDGLVWLDNSDGTGQVMAFCFDFVDVYAKKQLLRDRSLYSGTFFERELHLDYYYQHNRKELEKIGTLSRIVNQRGLTEAETQKLELSWNIGLGDYKAFWGRGRSLRRFWPWASFSKPTAAASSNRTIDVSYRASTNYPAPAVPFHRLRIGESLRELSEGADRWRLDGFVSYQEYVAELDNTRIAPSPFGLGEICWRDFETWLSGAMLLKPNMDHLETWPDYFENGVTSVAHAWDFTDLKQVTLDLLSNEARRAAIAEAGQTRFLSSLTEAAGEEFAIRLKALAETAISNRRGAEGAIATNHSPSGQ
ncbi:MAG: hypothetical protein CMJ78_15275 [Planctomycetaceae bacterium]|nr:hypothetical protein [Planctomycetaceae bacterium]